MRKSATCIALTLCFNALPAADAAFVIRLKNGHEYVTGRYWQEGTQILFDAEGGVFGIDKVFVNNIEQSDKAIKLVTVATQDPGQETQREVAKENAEKSPPAQAAKKQERQPDDPIVGELQQLKSKSNQVAGMLTSEIRQLLNEITAFKNKLLKDSKLFVEYGREFNDLQELSSVVEGALSQRNN
jgi:hypothetical protein